MALVPVRKGPLWGSMVAPLWQAHQGVNFGVRLERTDDSIGGTETVKMKVPSW